MSKDEYRYRVWCKETGKVASWRNTPEAARRMAALMDATFDEGHIPQVRTWYGRWKRI